MKKLLSIILSLAMVLGLCACSNTAKTMDEVRACLFPAGGEKDVEAAMELLLPLAEKGEAEAQYYYGWILDQELEENDENEKESLRWYRLAMEDQEEGRHHHIANPVDTHLVKRPVELTRISTRRCHSHR